jgi:hypothetical protein
MKPISGGLGSPVHAFFLPATGLDGKGRMLSCRLGRKVPKKSKIFFYQKNMIDIAGHCLDPLFRLPWIPFVLSLE